MGEVRFNAIGIDEVRDLFSSADAAARLRSLASLAFPPPPAPKASLLSKLGPMMRRPLVAPVIVPGVPTGRDLDDLVAGRDIPLERLPEAWTLVRLWVDDSSWSTWTSPLDEATLDALDFAGATQGVESRFALRKLFNDALRLPVKALPGQVTGYVRHTQANAMAAAWADALPGLPESVRPLAEDVVGWLGQLPTWADAAARAGRPAPDLVATYTAG